MDPPLGVNLVTDNPYSHPDVPAFVDASGAVSSGLYLLFGSLLRPAPRAELCAVRQLGAALLTLFNQISHCIPFPAMLQWKRSKSLHIFLSFVVFCVNLFYKPTRASGWALFLFSVLIVLFIVLLLFYHIRTKER